MKTRFYDFSYLSNKYIEGLRELTAQPRSGMNIVLDSLQNISNRKPKAKVICYYEKGKVVGWLLATKEKNNFFPDTRWNNKSGYWIQIFVKPEYRNKGIGKCLIDKYNKKIKSRTYFATLYRKDNELSKFGIFSNLKKGYSIY